MKLQLKIFLVTLLLAIPFRAHLQSTGKISVAEYIDQYNQLAMQEMKVPWLRLEPSWVTEWAWA